MEQIQVQLRVPEATVAEIDRWVSQGKFSSRSDAIKSIVSIYEEKEKAREFARMLVGRSKEASDNPEILIPLK